MEATAETAAAVAVAAEVAVVAEVVAAAAAEAARIGGETSKHMPLRIALPRSSAISPR